MTPKQREATAYHEAGHAVMCLFLKMPVKSVELFDAGEHPDYLGMMTSGQRKGGNAFAAAIAGDEPLDANPLAFGAFFRNLMVGLAGPIAEKLATGRHNNRGAGDDHDKAITYCEQITADYDEMNKLFRWISHRTRNILADPTRWAHVRRIARALVEKKKLTGRQVRQLDRYENAAEFEVESDAAVAHLKAHGVKFEE